MDEKVIECPPSLGCTCCDCQGRKCLLYHPGHSHLMAGLEYDLLKLLEEEEERKRDAE